jgi:hypothetical protein
MEKILILFLRIAAAYCVTPCEKRQATDNKNNPKAHKAHFLFDEVQALFDNHEWFDKATPDSHKQFATPFDHQIH